jgi:hypothetical protein
LDPSLYSTVGSNYAGEDEGNGESDGLNVGGSVEEVGQWLPDRQLIGLRCRGLVGKGGASRRRAGSAIDERQVEARADLAVGEESVVEGALSAIISGAKQS